MLRLPFNRYPSFGRDDPEYAYACGRVKALETKLLDRVRFERLATSRDIEELFKMLQDTDYSRYLNEVHKPSDFEILLRRELERLFSLISELSVESALEKDLRLPYDFLNLKILVKSLIFERDFSHTFSKYSYYPASLLKHNLETGKGDMLVKEIYDAYESAISSYYETREVFRIDTAVDNAMYKYFANFSLFEFLRIYYNLNADLKNLISFLRLERMGRLQALKHILLPAGYLPQELFYKVPDFNTLLYEIRHTVYYQVLQPGYVQYQKTGSFVKMEKDVANYFNGLVKEASKKDLSVEVLISYFFRKRSEISLLRMIMVSKVNQLPKELVIDRIPEVV
ncbi:MAG: V-type ATPase subunit [bacterium]|nr:V-type ATPase subunit [bacterium]